MRAKVFPVLVALAVFTAMAGRPESVSETKPRKVPPFPAKGIWIHSQEPVPKKFGAELTLVYFWDYTSVNCIREMSSLKRWDELYRPYGLTILLVHTPELDFARAPENVERALQKMEIPFPVFLDNDAKLWDAYGNNSWPSKYLVGRGGRIVYSKAGEGREFELESAVRRELQNLHPSAGLPPPAFAADIDRFDPERCGRVSSDLYLGYKRVNWWSGEAAGMSKPLPEETFLFQDGSKHSQRGSFVQGLWKNEAEQLVHARDTQGLTDYLGIYYVGYEAYAVANPRNTRPPARVYVTRDGVPVPPALRGADLHEDEDGLTFFLLDEPRLYYLVTGDTGTAHQLKLWADREGVAVNAFSFSNRCAADFEHL